MSNEPLNVEIGVTAQRLLRELAQVEARIIGTAKKAEQAWERSNRKSMDSVAASYQTAVSQMQRQVAGFANIRTDFASAEASALAFGAALDQRDAINRLQASMDPLHAATLRYQSAVRQVEAAVESGAISQAQANAVLRLAKSQYDLTTQSAQNLQTAQVQGAAGMARFLNISGNGRFVLQNTAAQLGDVAVQLQMGTDGMRVAGQQLPQILGGFGMLGGALGVVGPLLSVVAAVGIPVAAMLFTLGRNSEEAEEKLRTFADRVDEARSALQRAEEAIAQAGTTGLEDLRDRFGTITVEITRLADKLVETQQFLASQSIAGTFASIFPGLGDDAGSIREAVAEFERLFEKRNVLSSEIYGSAPITPERLDAAREELALVEEQLTGLQAIRGEIEAIAEELGISVGDAQALALGIARAQEASARGEFKEAAAAFAEMEEFARSLGLTIASGVVRSLIEAEALATEAANSLTSAEAAAAGTAAAAGGIAPAVGAAADEAGRLAGNLATALATLAGVTAGIAGQQRRAVALANLRLEYAGNPGGLAAAETRMEVNEASGAAAYEMIRTGNTGRLGDLQSTTDRLAQGAADVVAAEEAARAAEEAARRAASAGSSGSNVPSGGSRGGAGDSSPLEGFFDTSEREIEQLQRRIEMLGKTEAQAAALEARYRLLEEARQRGLDLDARQSETGETLRDQIERQAAAVGRLTEQYQRAEERAAFFEEQQQAVRDGILDSIVEGENLVGVLEDVAKAFARAALEAALFGTGPLSGGGGGGGGGGWFGTILGGLGGLFGGGRAGGGGVQAGRVYRVGEQGPEPFVPAVNGRILSVAQAQEAMRPASAGPSAVDVRVIGGDLVLTDSGEVMARVQVVAAGYGQQAVRTVEQNLPGYQARLQQDGTL